MVNSMKLAERVGFEPTVPDGITSFQDWLLKPLGHLSIIGSCQMRVLEYHKVTAMSRYFLKEFEIREITLRLYRMA